MDATGSSAALPVSLVLITLNEGSRIGGCLDSVPFASEIVVVDSGSDDDTAQVAAARGARVLQERWRGFGAQRQFAVGQAANDWVLCLDADERLTPELAESIRRELHSPRHHGYLLSRRNRFLGRWLCHGEAYPDWTLRLFDRRRAGWSDDPVHEKVVCDGSVGRLRGDLLHDSAESLERYLDKQNRYSTLLAERLAGSGARVSPTRMVASPALRFLRYYVLRRGFLDGVPGLVHIAIGAFASFLKYAKLAALLAARR